MSVTSPNVVWQDGGVTAAERRSFLGAAGATVWFTGLPASGKSTLASALERRLVESGRHAYLLDGDNLRHGLNGDLGFTALDRAENVRRTAEVARMFADAGLVALVSLVSPCADDRRLARTVHEKAGLKFIEVWVDTPVEECERRDPKGLYARARCGELRGLTGVDAHYEPPAHPDLIASAAADANALLAAIARLLP